MLQQLNGDTEETCTQYNIIKVTSGKGFLTGDPQWFDWAEKQFWNGMLGNQNLGGQWADSNSTGFHYMLPLGGPGLHKPWGDSSEGGFPCCWGTSVEQFAGRHLELPFSHSPDGRSLFVSMFMPLTLTWPTSTPSHGSPNAGVTVMQESGFPASTSFTTRLTLGGNVIGGGGANATDLTFYIRVPGWTSPQGGNPRVTLNGAPLPGPLTPGTFFKVSRAAGESWKSGDVIEAYFPASLVWEALPDDSPAAVGVGALRFGPILLAGINATEDSLPDAVWKNPSAFVSRVPPSQDLRFSLSTPSVSPCSGGHPINLTLAPLFEIKDEAYTVYWRPGPPPTAHYNGSSTLRVPGGESDWEGYGGFSSGVVLRSGNPGEVNIAYLETLIQDPTHAIGGVNFSYRYNVGYGPAGRERGSNFTVVLAGACASIPNQPQVLGLLYNSPADLVAPAYDEDPGKFSDIVTVNLTFPAPISVAQRTKVAFVFTNNDRNLNMPTPIDVTLHWV